MGNGSPTEKTIVPPPPPGFRPLAEDESLPTPSSAPVGFRPLEPWQLQPNLPQTPWGREEVAKQSMAEAASSGQAVLENFGMVGATLLVPEAAIPAAIAKYGPAAKLAYQAVLRTGAAGFGRGTGTAAGQELKRQIAPETAPTSPEEAWSEQWASAKEGAIQQFAFAEVGMPAVAKGAAATVKAIPENKWFENWDVVTKMKRLRSLEAERAQEMAKLSDGAAKNAAIEQARNQAEQTVSDIGPLISQETGKSQAGQLKVAIETSLNKAERERYAKLGEASIISMRPEAPGKVDTQPIIDRFVQLAKEIPVGSGFWRKWTELPEDVAAPMKTAIKQDKKIAQAAREVSETTAKAASEMAQAPQSLGVQADTTLNDLLSAINELKAAQDAHGATPVSVLLRARESMSRARANPNTSEDLVAIINELIPTKTTGPVDAAIHEGLGQINPVLIGEFQEAKHFWHQTETMKRMVLYKLFQKTGDPKPLANYIGPNDSRAVTRVRVLLQDIGQEAQWPAIQREVFTNLIVGRKGDVDLMGLSRRIDDWGSSTISQLTRAADGTKDAAMVARVDSLRNLSETYSKLVQTQEPVLTSRRLDQIDMMIKELRGGSDWRDAGKAAFRYMTSPHVLAGIGMGRVFGWGPALYGGLTSAALKESADAVIRLAYDPVRMNQFVRNMEAFVTKGDATSITNMARLADAAMKSVPAAKAGGEAFKNLLQTSHSPETQ